MSIETGLVAHLIADGPVNALVAGRVHPWKVPQAKTLPGPTITYEMVGDTSHRALSGPLDRTRPRFRIHCWAATSIVAADLAAKVRTSLDGFKGTMDDVAVSSVKFETQVDNFDDAPETYRRIVDFVIAHT